MPNTAYVGSGSPGPLQGEKTRLPDSQAITRAHTRQEQRKHSDNIGKDAKSLTKEGVVNAWRGLVMCSFEMVEGRDSINFQRKLHREKMRL